jgi:hypothetical protein
MKFIPFDPYRGIAAVLITAALVVAWTALINTASSASFMDLLPYSIIGATIGDVFRCGAYLKRR